MWRIPDEVVKDRDDRILLGFVKNQLVDPGKFMKTIRTSLYRIRIATSFDQLDFTDGRIFERYSQPQKIKGESVGRVWSFRDITMKETCRS